MAKKIQIIQSSVYETTGGLAPEEMAIVSEITGAGSETELPTTAAVAAALENDALADVLTTDLPDEDSTDETVPTSKAVYDMVTAAIAAALE